MKYFEVWAETSQRVYSDGTCEIDGEVAQDNIRKYFLHFLSLTSILY